ncbi:MAG TPA: hypothetical protein VLE22_03890 [Bryobacteraceae bacterium]|nr:hypothetical protein [Bryobacteraceae bacterium]
MTSDRTWSVLFLTILASCFTVEAEIRGVVATSGASFELGLPAKGSIASIFCAGIEVDGIVAADSLPLPRTLAGVRVWVGGAPAPLFAVAALQGFQQINIQVPHEAEFGAEAAEVVVEQNGQSGTATVPLRLSTPGDFFRFAGSNLGIFQHASDYSVVTPENPARPSEAIIAYLTGMPGTEPTVPTGEPAPFDPLAVVPQYRYANAYEHYEVFIGTSSLGVEPSFVGFTPGLVGVYQLNFVVPSDRPSAMAQLVLVRISCGGFFGSCPGNPLFTRTYKSTPVTIPIK